MIRFRARYGNSFHGKVDNCLSPGDTVQEGFGNRETAVLVFQFFFRLDAYMIIR
jgi:hypothetical protein